STRLESETNFRPRASATGGLRFVGCGIRSFVTRYFHLRLGPPVKCLNDLQFLQGNSLGIGRMPIRSPATLSHIAVLLICCTPVTSPTLRLFPCPRIKAGL